MKKVWFLLLDAMRADVLLTPRALEILAPNLAALAGRGFVRRVVANAQSTQFVLPALFTETYPLDHGGYNNGIRHRPHSFVESLRDHGYDTHLISTCNQMGITLGYDRGFQTIATTTDYRTILEQRIHRTLSYELILWKSGRRTDAEIATLVMREFNLLLDGIVDDATKQDRSIWPLELRRINQRVRQGCEAERELLRTDPKAILRKLVRIPAGIYWRFLGERQPSMLRFQFQRVVNGVIWRSRKWISRVTTLPLVHLSHHPTIFGQISHSIEEFFRHAAGRRWFVYMHLMDLHDCRTVNHPLHLIGRLRFFFRWLAVRRHSPRPRRWAYDSAIMYMDHYIGRLISVLRETGQLDDTIILVTSDHGSQIAESPRPKFDVGSRTFYEDIDVPMLLVNADRQPTDEGLLDSMSVTATLLDAAGIAPHPSFKGKSAFSSGRRFVVSESCGSGNADLSRRDIYFTVTSESHKMMAVLTGSALQPTALYDLRQDPNELWDILSRPGSDEVIRAMCNDLRAERGEIFELRKVNAVAA